MSKPFYDAAGCPMFPGSSKSDKMFGPDELNKLQGIFDDCLKECGFSRDCHAAEDMGSAIIRLFAQGQRDPAYIKAMIVPSFQRRA